MGLHGVTIGCMRLEGGYKGLQGVQGVTGAYKGFQGVAKGYKGLQGVTIGYRALLGDTRDYRRLQGVTGCYRGLHGLQGLTCGLKGVTGCHKNKLFNFASHTQQKADCQEDKHTLRKLAAIWCSLSECKMLLIFSKSDYGSCFWIVIILIGKKLVNIYTIQVYLLSMLVEVFGE